MSQHIEGTYRVLNELGQVILKGSITGDQLDLDLSRINVVVDDEVLAARLLVVV